MSGHLYIHIDDKKKRRLKSLAALRKDKIKDIINHAIDDYLLNEGKPEWHKK